MADGDPGASLLCSARDVTARVETEQELALSGQMLAAAFDLAPVGMALVDLDGTWRDLNQALCRLLGTGRDELLATELEALSHPDEQRAGLTLAGCLTSRGPSFTLTTRYRHGDGCYLPIEQSVGVIGGAEGEPAHAIVYFQSARPGPSVPGARAEMTASLTESPAHGADELIVVTPRRKPRLLPLKRPRGVGRNLSKGGPRPRHIRSGSATVVAAAGAARGAVAPRTALAPE